MTDLRYWYVAIMCHPPFNKLATQATHQHCKVTLVGVVVANTLIVMPLHTCSAIYLNVLNTKGLLLLSSSSSSSVFFEPFALHGGGDFVNVDLMVVEMCCQAFLYLSTQHSALHRIGNDLGSYF